MSETWNSIITGAVGGLIVLGVQEIISLYRVQKKSNSEKLITPKRYTHKHITNDVLQELSPGSNLELMRELLGTPIKYNKTDYPVFQEKKIATNSYLFSFKNALLKITSKDNISIDSVTVIAHDCSIELDKIAFNSPNNEYRLNKARIDQTIIDHLTNHDFIKTRIDASFALQFYIPNPLYKSFTYFGTSIEKGFTYLEDKNPSNFTNEIISGFCISNDSEDTYFIYDMEIR